VVLSGFCSPARRPASVAPVCHSAKDLTPGLGSGSNGAREALMRVLLFATVVVTAILFDLRTGHAYYGNGPWCAVESVGFSTVIQDCSMRDFEQCRLLTIAGNRGFCTPNPYWTGPHEPVEPRRRTHKRRTRAH